MTIARSRLIDHSTTRWYHCVSRCVRRAFLLGEGKSNRKEWIENRIKELAEIFAVGIGGFSVMDNHLHLLVRLDPDVANSWSDEEVVRRWGRLFPPRDKSRQPLPVTEDWAQGRLKDVQWVATTRVREGKAAISADLAGIFERLGSNAKSWQLRQEKLRESPLFGRFFAASRARLAEVAQRLGVRHVANLGGSPAQ